MSKFKAACVQLRSGEDVAENIAAASTLIRDAAAAARAFVATPENTTLMAADGGAKLAQSFDEAHDPALPRFSSLAKELGVWLLIGSLAIKVSDTKTANRSFLIGPDGSVRARYSKIHLFDVDLAGGESYRESSTVAGGDFAVLADTEWGKLGLSVCYDLRFPQLYRISGEKRRFRVYRAVRLHGSHRRGALACAVAGAGDRERRLCHRPGPGRKPCQWPQNLWSQPDCGSLGNGPGRSRNRSRGDLCRHRPGAVAGSPGENSQPAT